MSLLQLGALTGLGGQNAIAARLARYGQEHLLRYWDELSDQQRRQLAEQIDAVDFQRLAQLVHDDAPRRQWTEAVRRAEAPPAIRLADPDRKERAAEARRWGEAALQAGKVGVIIVAGGQGTRLGSPCPKGAIPVGPVSGRSLLQILMDRILAVGQRYNVRIPVYLMTSQATHAQTVEYLEQNDRFGLEPQELHVFRQGVMPAVSIETGKVLMAARDALCLAPNGHGGMVEALMASGGLDAAIMRGVELFFYCQVDNPLAPCCDPELIGFHLAAGSEMTTLAVSKSHPQERVGNIVAIDGKVQILEYSELPPEIGQQRNADGGLRLWAGNTAIHVFDARFLRRAAADPEILPYHRAEKETPCLDAQGRLTTPSRPNAIKFERFIFDLLPHARSALVVEGVKEEIFAPVKNASGAAFDTPETAQAAMIALHRHWLEAVGVTVAPDVAVEINPRFALNAEELAAKIRPGLTINQSTYLT